MGRWSVWVPVCPPFPQLTEVGRFTPAHPQTRRPTLFKCQTGTRNAKDSSLTLIRPST